MSGLLVSDKPQRKTWADLGEYIIQRMEHLPDGESEKRIAFIIYYIPIAFDGDMERNAQPDVMKQAYDEWLKTQSHKEVDTL